MIAEEIDAVADSWWKRMGNSKGNPWLFKRLGMPLLALIRMGATPEILAWSLAAGSLIGINPILGSTSILCFVTCFALKLNPVAGQIANHLVFPFQLILLVPFIRLASDLFGMPGLPMSPRELLAAAHASPLRFTRQLWRWESRAFLVWLALSVLLAPLIAYALTPVLELLMRRMGASEATASSNR